MGSGPEDDLIRSRPGKSKPSPPSPHPDAEPEGEAGAHVRIHGRRLARREGREVARLSCVGAGISFAVECDVFPVNAMRAVPLQPGPYRFDNLAEAKAFLLEAAQALAYLGCNVVDPDVEDEDGAQAA
jgi:hypothetical protein